MGDYRLQAIKEFILALFRDPRCLYQEENVLYCDKLFIVNSAMKWLYNKITEESMELSEMKSHLNYINLFLDDKVELNWQDGTLVVDSVQQTEKE